MGATDLYSNVLSVITDAASNKGKYRAILKFDYGMVGLDVINKTLILMQGKHITDIRTVEEWELVGRAVVDKEQGIKIIIPTYKSKYVSVRTGVEIGLNEFSGEDRKRAVELGVIEKVKDLQSVHTDLLYDIENTKESPGLSTDTSGNIQTYKRMKPVLGISETLALLEKLTVFKVMKGTENKTENSLEMDYEQKAIYAYRTGYDELAVSAIEVLSDYFIERDKTGIGISEKAELELLSDSLKYTLSGIFMVRKFKGIRNFEDVSRDIKISNLFYIDGVVQEVISNMKFTNKQVDLNIADRVSRLRMADDIYDILEAYSISRMLGNK